MGPKTHVRCPNRTLALMQSLEAEEYDSVLTPQSSRKRKFGVRRRTFGSSESVVENARDGRETTRAFDNVRASLAIKRDVPNFNFRDDDDAASVRTERDRSNGAGKYMQKPQPRTGRVITPGASIMAKNEEEERLSKLVVPPSKADTFLARIQNNKAPASASRIRSVAPPQTTRRLGSSLEAASAPTSAKPARSALSRDEWIPPTKMKRTDEEPKSTRSRVELTPAKRRQSMSGNAAPAAGPARTSSRIQSRPTRVTFGMYDSDETPSNATVSRRNSMRVPLNGGLMSTRRSSRASNQPTEGTEDMPIHLSDSDEGDDFAAADDNAKEIESEVIDDDDLDMTVINKELMVGMEDHRAWIGDRACGVDLFFCQTCMWLTSIKGVDRKWDLPRNYKVPFNRIKRALIYRLQPDVGDASDPTDFTHRVMSTVSFIALQFPIPDTMNKSKWRTFYDPTPQTSDAEVSTSKHYFVVASKDGDEVGASLGLVEDVLRGRHIDVELLKEPGEIRPFASTLFENDHHYLFSSRPSPRKEGAKRSRRRREGTEDEGDVTQLTYPLPPCTVDIVTITRQDISRLQPREYLNDNIIDYYFKRLLLEDYADNELVKQNVLFLSSHFYSRLAAGKGSTSTEKLRDGYNNVSTWLTRSDLFSRCLVFIPINKATHWSMAVIVNPKCAGVIDDDDENSCPLTCIALLDPLGTYHRLAPILRNLKSFLQKEWANSNSKNSSDMDEVPPYEAGCISALSVKAPLQDNGYDCGVFVLKYAQEMLANFATILEQADDVKSGYVLPREFTDDALSALIPVDSFSPRDVTAKRKELEDLLAQDTKRYEAILEKKQPKVKMSS